MLLDLIQIVSTAKGAPRSIQNPHDTFRIIFKFYDSLVQLIRYSQGYGIPCIYPVDSYKRDRSLFLIKDIVGGAGTAKAG